MQQQREEHHAPTSQSSHSSSRHLLRPQNSNDAVIDSGVMFSLSGEKSAKSQVLVPGDAVCIRLVLVTVPLTHWHVGDENLYVVQMQLLLSA